MFISVWKEKVSLKLFLISMIKTQLFIAVSLFLAVFFNSSLEKKNDYFAIAKGNQEKTALEKSIANGKEIYADFCVQCHLATGKGDAKNFPPLDGSDWFDKKIAASIHAIKYGQTGEITVNGKKFNNTMPQPVGLSNKEIADVMNYIRNGWSNKHPKMITLEQVEKVKL